MRLFLVQHGLALPKEAHADRPLSDQGRCDIRQLACFLKSAGVEIARTLHSDRTRARETAEIIVRTLALPQSPEISTELAPNSPVAPWVDAIASWDTDTLVVGHLPFLGRLTALLVTGREEQAVADFQPGTALCLAQTEDGWRIAWMLRPDLFEP